jgi:hypothetical protein
MESAGKTKASSTFSSCVFWPGSGPCRLKKLEALGVEGVAVPSVDLEQQALFSVFPMF